MNNKTYWLILPIILLWNCNTVEQKSEDAWKEIKHTRFVNEYQDYLIKYPNSNHTIEIIDSLRIFRERAYKQKPDTIPPTLRNTFSILLNSADQLLMEGEMVETKDIQAKLATGTLNKNNRRILDAEILKNIKNGKEIKIPSYNISIKTSEKFSPHKLSEIIVATKKAIDEVRNEYALIIYDKNFKNLKTEEKEHISILLPYKINFEKRNPAAIPPLPPPIKTDRM